MLGPTEVLHVLRDAPLLTSLVPANHIVAFSVPEALTDSPRLLITDVRAPFTRFASNGARGRYKTVQVQGWFDPAFDIESVQLELNTALENARWFNSYDAGVIEDPDTSELFFTMQYSKNQIGV